MCRWLLMRTLLETTPSRPCTATEWAWKITDISAILSLRRHSNPHCGMASWRRGRMLSAKALAQPTAGELRWCACPFRQAAGRRRCARWQCARQNYTNRRQSQLHAVHTSSASACVCSTVRHDAMLCAHCASLLMCTTPCCYYQHAAQTTCCDADSVYTFPQNIESWECAEATLHVADCLGK